MFSTLFTNYTCIYRDIPYFDIALFKVFCYRFVVYGKGQRPNNCNDISYDINFDESFKTVMACLKVQLSDLKMSEEI